MPPFWWCKNGKLAPQTGGGGLAGTSISKNFITDQTFERLSSDLSLATNWGFVVGEGLGSAGLAGSTVGHILAHGDGNDIRVTTEWKWNSSGAGASYGVIGRMATYLNPDDFYYWLRVFENDSIRLTTTNGGTANLDTQALGKNLVAGEIFQLIYEITDTTGAQDHLGTFKGRGRTDNVAGAATYDLDGIAAGADTEIQIAVDGGALGTVTFAAGDFANYAACTGAEIVIIIENTLPTTRAWLVGNIIYISTNTFGAAGSIEIDAGLANDANAVLGLTTGAEAGDEQTVSAADATYTYGFIGFRGGFSGNTSTYIRNIDIEYLT